MLKATDEHCVGFGEIIYGGVVKGWHKHAEMTLNYACSCGRVKLALYDDRKDSATTGALQEMILGPRQSHARRHPTAYLEGFKGMNEHSRSWPIAARIRAIRRDRRASTPSTTTSRTTGRPDTH